MIKQYVSIFVLSMVIPCFASKKIPIEDRNILTNVKHHKGNERTIEMASIILYFDKEPIIKPMRQVAFAHNKEEQIFFFPMVKPNAEMLKQIVKHMKDELKNSYDVIIKEVTKPTQGINVIMHYDPERIGIGYELSDSIGLQKAVIFRIYNKPLLQTIKQKGKNVLRVAHHVPTVVIDCGHGGSDIGTIANNQLQEKDLCLSIGLQVAQMLEEYPMSILLTRDADITVSLDERTSLANMHNADLFVSIHANYAANKQAQGIETFYTDPALFKKKFCTLNTSEYEAYTQARNERYDNSLLLAQQVHTAVLKSLHTAGYTVVDRKIKRTLSQVLGGTTMPAILIEVGFLSHQIESQLLQQPDYQDTIAKAIAQGITSFLPQS